MKIAVAADHGGYPIKERIIRDLIGSGNEVSDLGTNSTDPVDYPDYAKAVADAVLQGRAERAILICGSGAGACVAANKFAGIRAATCHDVFSAHQAVEDDDCNVMCLGARIVTPGLVVSRTAITTEAPSAVRARRPIRQLNCNAPNSRRGIRRGHIQD